MAAKATVLADRIYLRIFLPRGQNVTLSPDLAQLYDVKPCALVKRAIQVNVGKSCAPSFVSVKCLPRTPTSLASSMRFEKKYDTQFKIVFDAIRKLMTPPQPKRIRIGFRNN